MGLPFPTLICPPTLSLPSPTPHTGQTQLALPGSGFWHRQADICPHTNQACSGVVQMCLMAHLQHSEAGVGNLCQPKCQLGLCPKLLWDSITFHESHRNERSIVSISAVVGQLAETVCHMSTTHDSTSPAKERSNGHSVLITQSSSLGTASWLWILSCCCSSNI